MDQILAGLLARLPIHGLPVLGTVALGLDQYKNRLTVAGTASGSTEFPIKLYRCFETAYGAKAAKLGNRPDFQLCVICFIFG